MKKVFWVWCCWTLSPYYYCGSGNDCRLSFDWRGQTGSTWPELPAKSWFTLVQRSERCCWHNFAWDDETYCHLGGTVEQTECVDLLPRLRRSWKDGWTDLDINSRKRRYYLPAVMKTDEPINIHVHTNTDLRKWQGHPVLLQAAALDV